MLTLLLLYQSGYEVGRYISLERIVEESKETYYEVLLKSSNDWHEPKHDLRPWWEYFLGRDFTIFVCHWATPMGLIAPLHTASRQ